MRSHDDEGAIEWIECLEVWLGYSTLLEESRIKRDFLGLQCLCLLCFSP